MNGKTPCPLWGAMDGGDTFKKFSTHIIPHFELVDSVPDSIKNRIDTIYKLLQYAYYEYDFIDVAMERCYHTLELALQLKFAEINPAKKRKPNLKPALDWAVNHGYLNLSKNQKDELAYLRNHVAHLKSDRTGGITQFNMIKVVGNDLINELFM